jgi:ubiquinone/menaquinone biosynthesis C-methylase UbiE
VRSSRQGQSWQPFDSNEEAARRFEILDSTPDVRGQREEALRQLSLEPGETVIDVGCGPGYGRYFFGKMRYFFLARKPL